MAQVAEDFNSTLGTLDMPPGVIAILEDAVCAVFINGYTLALRDLSIGVSKGLENMTKSLSMVANMIDEGTDEGIEIPDLLLGAWSACVEADEMLKDELSDLASYVNDEELH
jgi:hypothetical protein